MKAFDLVIRGGTVVRPDEIGTCDVGIRDGRIESVGHDLGPARRVIAAEGLLVLPGGIDSHCHIEEPPTPTYDCADSFVSATTSALCGGTTSVVCFIRQAKGGDLEAAAEDYFRRAESSLIDYSFHLTVTDPTERTLAALPGLIARGCRSIKVFLAYDDAQIDDASVLRILALARREGALVCVHAENHDTIRLMTERLLQAGLVQPRYHAWAKPVTAEREATHRIAAFAELTGAPVQVFHVSGDQPASEIGAAQRRGVRIWGETCPQYLVLTAADLDRPGDEGLKYVFSPPARTTSDQEALWEHIRAGVIDVVSSDHSPLNFNSARGKKAGGADAPFATVPNGIPGLETRMALLFSEGVARGRIDLRTFVDLTSTNPAKLFGLYPRKGVIAPGADADIVLWDSGREVVIRNDLLHHAVDYTPYEGLAVTGWPATTISRGEVVWDGASVSAQARRGRFLARAPYDYIAGPGPMPTPFDPVTGEVAAGGSGIA